MTSQRRRFGSHHSRRRQCSSKRHQSPEPTGESYKRINENLVQNVMGMCSNQSAPGEDKVGTGIVKLVWEWGAPGITELVREGVHPAGWKSARGIVIPKPSKTRLP